MTDSTPGWQPDPSGKHDHRYWDGSQWTDNVSDAGVASTDPYVPDVGGEDATVVDAPVPAGDEPTAPVDVPAAAAPPADTTAAWPAAPAGPPPLPYNAPDSTSTNGGGSKRNLLIGGGILAVIAVAVIAFFALGGDDDDGDSVRAQLASKLVEEGDGELTGDQARCMADLLVDEVGEDAFADTDFDAEDAPAEVIEAFLAVGEDEIAERCGIEDTDTDGGETDDGGDDGGDDGDVDDDLQSLRDDCADGDFTACDDLYFAAELGSDLEEFGSTCGGIADPQNGFCEQTNGGQDDPDSDFDVDDLPDDVLDSIVEQYEQMGLDRDKAECLAAAIFDAMEEGALDETEVTTDFMAFLSDCDISLEEMNGG